MLDILFTSHLRHNIYQESQKWSIKYIIALFELNYGNSLWILAI